MRSAIAYHLVLLAAHRRTFLASRQSERRIGGESYVMLWPMAG